MKRIVAILAATTFCLQAAIQPVEAGMSDKDKAAAAAAAIAILGIAALAHNKHHYQEGYEPGSGEEMAEFERGYRDGSITTGIEGMQFDEAIEPRLSSTVCTGGPAGLLPDKARAPGHPSRRGLGASTKARGGLGDGVGFLARRHVLILPPESQLHPPFWHLTQDVS